MTLSEALNIDLSIFELISVVGAGGKTSTLFRLAQELKACGKSVLVTTTTNMASSEASRADRVIVDCSKDLCLFSQVEPGTIVCLGGSMVNDRGKLKGVDPEYISEIYQKHVFDFIVVEADGSKRKPIKAPAHYEPLIPSATTRVIGVIGLDALGKAITEEHVHRPELFCSVTGKNMGDIIDRQCLVSLIISKNGLFKNVGEGCRKLVVLNKADYPDREEEGRLVANELKRTQAPPDDLIIAAMGTGWIYTAWSADAARETGPDLFTGLST
jgi:probable selenium-dependent hydroxylase accessory protein YqeC